LRFGGTSAKSVASIPRHNRVLSPKNFCEIFNYRIAVGKPLASPLDSSYIPAMLSRVRNSRGRPKARLPLLLFPVVPPSPLGPGCLVYQFAEAVTKLNIKNILDAVRALTH